MYFEYHHSKTTKTISPLQVQLIYHVQADCTYQTNHIAGSNGSMIFVYTYQGQGFLKCPEGEFILTSGTALVFSSDAPYFYKTFGTEWNFWWFEFQGSSPCSKGRVYNLPMENWIKNICSMALHALRQETSLAASYLSCLLAYVIDSQQMITTPDNEFFLKAQTLIKEKLYRINVSTLAKELSMDSRTLYNLFMRHSGTSPKNYIRNYTLNHARYLLTNTTKTIGEIAMETGFSNQFHFSKVFHKECGISPSQYRKSRTVL
jgi:AraC-like DNA-binding protein